MSSRAWGTIHGMMPPRREIAAFTDRSPSAPMIAKLQLGGIGSCTARESTAPPVSKPLPLAAVFATHAPASVQVPDSSETPAAAAATAASSSSGLSGGAALALGAAPVSGLSRAASRREVPPRPLAVGAAVVPSPASALAVSEARDGVVRERGDGRRRCGRRDAVEKLRRRRCGSFSHRSGVCHLRKS